MKADFDLQAGERMQEGTNGAITERDFYWIYLSLLGSGTTKAISLALENT